MRCALYALALASFALCGCSLLFNHDNHQSDAVPIPASELCAQLAELTCNAAADCCTLPGFDRDGCITRAATDCATAIGGIALDPRTGYDAVLAGVRIAEARRLAETCDPAFYATLEGRAGVIVALGGTLSPGASCNPPFEAASLFACTGADRCIATSASEGICEATGQLDEPCTINADCDYGLQCTLSAQTCQPLLPDGSTCRDDDQCESGYCTGGLLVAGACGPPTVQIAYCDDMD